MTLKLLESQLDLFSETLPQKARINTTSTFVDNMKLPVHRWYRFSAGFSAKWAELVINNHKTKLKSGITVLDPFAGSGTTLIAAESVGVNSYGIEAHPFIISIARAKLFYKTDLNKYIEFAKKVKSSSLIIKGKVSEYPPLIHKCFTKENLASLDRLRRAWELHSNGTPESELVWLTIVSLLRMTSNVGTAPWQYVLPKKIKKNLIETHAAFDLIVRNFSTDMSILGPKTDFNTILLNTDARTCKGVPDNSIDLIITSPPYANNYDYADATRLEMSFMKTITGWGDLQNNVRKYLIRSCTQHVPLKDHNLDEILNSEQLKPIAKEIREVCEQLGDIRLERGGKKTYHLMIACYFLDIAKTWIALRRVAKTPSNICFVIGDSAPYGIYVPVIEWMSTLAKAAGFKSTYFEKTRDRNIKWKNRKHRVPLCEGRLWVKG